LHYTWLEDDKNIDWSEASNLYKIAPLGDKSAESLQTVFSNSMFKCFVFDNNILIAIGRALADGVDASYICDIAIHPNYQGQGLGKAMVNKLVTLSSGHKKILLYAVPGKEGFYQQLGFRKMNTAMAIFENQQQAIENGFVS